MFPVKFLKLLFTFILSFQLSPIFLLLNVSSFVGFSLPQSAKLCVSFFSFAPNIHFVFLKLFSWFVSNTVDLFHLLYIMIICNAYWILDLKLKVCM